MNNQAFADLFKSPLVSGNSSNYISIPSQNKKPTIIEERESGNTISNINTLIKSFSYREDKNLKFRKSMEDFGYTEINLISDYKTNLFSIYDGHGGTDVVKYIKDRLPQIIKQNIVNGISISSSLTDAFSKIESELRFYDSEYTGSTASVIVIQYNKLYCANVGDSRAYLISKSSVRQITTDHKCTEKEEADRIMQSGGNIHKGRVNGQLVLSRTLGDFNVKKYGVSAIPSISVSDITNDITYCVIASDGVWDVVDEKCLLDMSKQYENADAIAKKIVETAIENGSKDNISCIVVSFI